MSGSNYVYTITLDTGQAAGGLSSLQSNMQAATASAGSLQSAFDRIGRAAFAFVNISESVERLMGTLDDLAEPGVRLNAAMASLSAVSGVTGKSLQQIEGYARQAAKTFGGSASDSVEAYQLVLSQLGPHIAQVPEALAAMGESIKTTCKLMGNDTAAAAEVLTTALNQYQVALDDPLKASEEMARMMNVMAAAGQAGSAELPTIKEALKQAGMMAKTSGVSFEEANAAIQMLDKAGKKGSEGGVALRNVMSTLAQGRFLPQDVQEELAAAGVSIDRLTDKSLSLTDRLRGLSPIMQDQALISKMFGRENAASAIALMSVLDPIDELTAAISGSNSAYEQAGIIMDSDVEKMSRFQARIDDIKISLYNVYSGIYPYIKGLGGLMQSTANIAIAANAMHTLSETALAKSIRQRTAATWKSVVAAYGAGGALGMFSAAAAVAKIACHGLAVGFKAVSAAIYNIPVIGWVLLGITLLVKGFKALWNKCEAFRQGLFGIWEWLKAMFYNIGVVFSTIWDNGIKPVVDRISEAFRTVVDGIVGAFNWCRDGIVNAFNWVWEKVSSVFVWIRDTAASVTAWVADKFSWLIQPIMEVFSKIANFVRDTFDKIKNGIIGTIEGIKSFFSGKGFKSGRDAWKSGLQKGTESFQKDHPDTRQDMSSDTMTVPAVADMDVPDIAKDTATASGMTGPKVSGSGTVDLNNVKGSTDYAAVSARLQPKAFAGLGGGVHGAEKAAGNLPEVSSSQPTLPELPSFIDEQPEDKTYSLLQRIANDVSKMAAGITIAALPAMPLAAQPSVAPAPQVQPVTAAWQQPDPRNGKAGTYVAKFCDKVEINVPAGTTERQVETILNELMRRINDAVE